MLKDFFKEAVDWVPVKLNAAAAILALINWNSVTQFLAAGGIVFNFLYQGYRFYDYMKKRKKQ